MRLTNEQFLQRAREKHNNRYEYPDKYLGMKTKIRITCKVHGDFYQTPDNHLKKRHPQGCKKCAIEEGSFRSRISHEQFVARANIVHNDRYAYPDPYVNAHTKIRITCKIHGDFYQTPNNHTHGSGKGCPRCAEMRVGACNRDNNDTWVMKASMVHHGAYNYHMVDYINSMVEVTIECPIHGLFTQRPSHHIQGAGCPDCTNRISKPSNEWLDSIEIPDDPDHREVHGLVMNKRYSVDGYDPATKTVYEFHGDYWHGNPDKFDPNDINPSVGKTFGQLYENTQRKKKTFLDAGFNYIEMWESDWLKMT